jgi:hypothetical protein
VNLGKGFAIHDVLNYPFIRNADSFAPTLPIALLLRRYHREIEALKPEVCAKGASFADIRLAIRRRSSLQEYGFAIKIVPLARRRGCGHLMEICGN